MSLSTNEYFNKQFVMTDFRLIQNKDFIKFVGIEYGIYLILRESVWRSSVEHYMGLHSLYKYEHLLASSLTREKIAELAGIHVDNISRHLSSLKKQGMIEVRDTGRQKIFVLGEWADVKGDGSLKIEWFYIDGVFGVPKPGESKTGPESGPKTVAAEPEKPSSDSDLTQTVRSETAMSSDQTRRKPSGQTRRKPSDNNKEENREENTTVNVNGDKENKGGKGSGDIIRELPVLDIDPAHRELIAETIVQELGDNKSQSFYQLIAGRIPKDVIMTAISSVKNDGARNRGAVFTHKMRQYAEESLGKLEPVQQDIQADRLNLAEKFSTESSVYGKRDSETDTS